jgi:hypothetical protein
MCPERTLVDRLGVGLDDRCPWDRDRFAHGGDHADDADAVVLVRRQGGNEVPRTIG